MAHFCEFTTVEEYRRAFDEGRYVDMAVSYCHEGFSRISWCVPEETCITHIDRDPEVYYVGIGLCSHEEIVLLSDVTCYPDNGGSFLEVVDNEPIEFWPLAAQRAARRVGEHILKELEKGIGGCQGTMSLDITLYEVEACAKCGHAYPQSKWTAVYRTNITHNLNKMAKAAGIYEPLWRPEELWVTPTARDLAGAVKLGLDRLLANPETYKPYNAENGWGTYGDFVPWLEDLVDACGKWPDARVEVSR